MNDEVLAGYLVERYPGVDILKVMALTDRQIVAAYFPDKAERQHSKGGTGLRSVFWAQGKRAGLTDAAIQAEWDKRKASQPARVREATTSRKQELDRARKGK